jgi:hypothetical protein
MPTAFSLTLALLSTSLVLAWYAHSPVARDSGVRLVHLLD